MKKETRTFPLENLISIEIDRENGVALAMYEEKETTLEVGKWYQYNNHLLLYIGDKDGLIQACGFAMNDDNAWRSVGNYGDTPHLWERADMKEVKNLLIAEADKKYSKGVVIIDAYSETRTTVSKVVLAMTANNKNVCCGDGVVVFNGSTGKWAEIIEEKKPLYVNAYGTEFFGDEKVWDVQKSTLIIRETGRTTSMLIDLGVILKEDDSCSEILKDRDQCLLWIKDNIHKLR